ncbi:hypothetical protein AT746_05550 [Lacimicrobium alkaliphilum]|uniref:Uncharacterized protein n=2 Tax=Lacimicrobium alkaliphilum TaxID=1526571 RepID=A0A0U3AUL7_9ALTE|nr:hypothetical protein AT746_05550 [Lacimicrobium alkaliphilum]
MNIEFMHYTLNIDNLLEQSGGTVTHVYGCINNIQSLLDQRDLPTVDLSTFIWERGDIVFFLGISEDGLPLAHIESMIITAGGTPYHYNLSKQPHLTGKQVQGDLLDILSCTEVLRYVPLTFEDFDVGEKIPVQVAQFELLGEQYEIYFTPKTDTTSTLPAETLAHIEQVTGVITDEHTYEIKFDLVSNREKCTPYQRPKSNFQLKEMRILGEIIIAFINAHSATIDVSLYIAQAQYSKLNAFYARLANVTKKRVEFDHWLLSHKDHGYSEGDYHAFKPTRRTFPTQN